MTDSEFNLLIAFLADHGQVLSREQLLESSRLQNNPGPTNARLTFKWASCAENQSNRRRIAIPPNGVPVTFLPQMSR